MAEYGVTENGFVIKRLPVILASIEAKITARMGDYNQEPDSQLGQISGVYAEQAAVVWEEMEKVYQSQYPASAEGFSLDNTLQFNALKRLGATSSTCPVLLIGNQGTLVPEGKQFEENINSQAFQSSADITVGIANVTRLIVGVNTVASTHVYTISIESIPYTYEAQPTDTEEEIIAGLVVDITTNQPESVEQVTAVDNFDETMTILAEDKKTNVAIVLDSLLDADEIGSSILTKSLNTGPITAPVNTIDSIITPVSGLTNVINLVAATAGRNLENNVEARSRRRISLAKLGNATIEAMRSKMLDDVDGVTAVTINTNRTDDTVGSLPPHSLEFIIVGGTDPDVAEKIWAIYGGGIQLYGNESEIVVDSQGRNQTILFTRPADVFGYVEVVITKVTDGTEAFPANGIQAVTDAIEEFGDTYNIGEDILIQRFYSPIFSVAGIKSAIVKVDKDDAPWNPSYSPIFDSNDIEMDSDEKVIWNQDVSKQILVTIAP